MNTKPNTKHVISVLIANEPSAHERLSNTLRRRAPGVVETSIASGEEEGMARVTVVLYGELTEANFALTQIAKLVDVIEAKTLEADQYYGRQLALIRINAAGANQDEASDILTQAGARLLRVHPFTLIAELTTSPETIDATIQALSALGEVVSLRTGLVALRL
jgi:acetolactate synthase-1/3 small subunit